MLNAIMVVLLLASSPIALMLFLIKWFETDMDTAYDTFEAFIRNILK